MTIEGARQTALALAQNSFSMSDLRKVDPVFGNVGPFVLHLQLLSTLVKPEWFRDGRMEDAEKNDSLEQMHHLLGRGDEAHSAQLPRLPLYCVLPPDGVDQSVPHARALCATHRDMRQT